MKNFKISFIVTCLFVFSVPIMAQQSDDNEQRKRKGPPPQAIEACNGLNEGDACQFSGRRGDVTGTCSIPPNDDTTLACKPQRSKSKD